ncbi:MAG: type II toxin-antitoxin system prevent-host-death family antitoxin [Chloroflexi bacterium]|nr:type II toxin-antitoxin system prevent-host-death family antitoxin [Chloroflexota bacterium]
MTTYSVREFKARISEILRGLEDGEEVIITRRGKPCGRLTPVGPSDEGKPSLRTLRGALSYLPEVTYEDFLEIKRIWELTVPPGPEKTDQTGAR